MKTFLEHTKDQQDEGLKDMAKKGLEKAKGMMKPKAGGEKKPGLVDRVKAGAKKVVQAVGRSVRDSEDTAITYILDSDWSRFYNKNKKLFCEDFKRLIV